MTLAPPSLKKTKLKRLPETAGTSLEIFLNVLGILNVLLNNGLQAIVP